MAHGTHMLDQITRVGALNAISTARRIASRRYADTPMLLEVVNDTLDYAEQAIKVAPAVEKVSRVTRFKSAITGRFMKKADAMADPATSYATRVQSSGGMG